jgi:hypothetical protein
VLPFVVEIFQGHAVHLFVQQRATHHTIRVAMQSATSTCRRKSAAVEMLGSLRR